MNSVLETLGVVANLIEIVSFIIVIFLFFQAQRALRRYLAAREGDMTERPWVVAVGIGGDISGQVKPCLPELRLETAPLEIYVQEKRLKETDFYAVLRDMLKIKNRLSQAGVTEVHLFYRGPVTLAMGIGSMFDNWVPVKVYEYTAGKYHLDFVLEKGSVLGLLGSDPVEALREAIVE